MFKIQFDLLKSDQFTIVAISEISRLNNSGKKSYMLNFTSDISKRIRITTCKGLVPNAYIVLKERNSEIEDSLTNFNIAIGTSNVDLEINLSSLILEIIIIPRDEITHEHLKKLWI